MPIHKGGKSGTRKYNRMRDWCKSYRARGIREKNKRRKLEKHFRVQLHDICAQLAFAKLGKNGNIR